MAAIAGACSGASADQKQAKKAPPPPASGIFLVEIRAT